LIAHVCIQNSSPALFWRPMLTSCVAQLLCTGSRGAQMVAPDAAKEGAAGKRAMYSPQTRCDSLILQT